MPLKDEMQKEIASWENVVERPNKYGTPSFFVSGREFAHFHSDTQMDIKVAKSILDKKDKRVSQNPHSNAWFLFNFKNQADATKAIEFVKAAYKEAKAKQPETKNKKTAAPNKKLGSIDEILARIEGEAEHADHLPIVGSVKGKFLEELVRKEKPSLVLEVGTLVGYSAIRIARNLSKGKIVTVEKMPEMAEKAKQNIAEAGLAGRVEILAGDALEIIPKLKEKFDFIFIDAKKTEYFEYLKLLEKNMHKGTVVVADNAKMFASHMVQYLDYVRTSKLYKSKFYDFDFDGMEVSVRM